MKPKAPKAQKTPHFSVLFFSKSTRGIARGDSAKKHARGFNKVFLYLGEIHIF